jgi:translation initiation factor 4G
MRVVAPCWSKLNLFHYNISPFSSYFLSLTESKLPGGNMGSMAQSSKLKLRPGTCAALQGTVGTWHFQALLLVCFLEIVMDHLLPAQHQPPPHHHPPGPAPLSSALPMSPRNPPLSLQQVPGTPTPSQSHPIPPTGMHHPPYPSGPPPAPFTTSPPSTPSTANLSTSLSANAGAFVPAKKVSIKNASGQEVTLDTLKRAPPPTIPPHPPSPASVNEDIRRQPIRIESQEQKEKRFAEERANEGKSDDKSKSSDTLVRANDVTSRCEVEEQERKLLPRISSGSNPLTRLTQYP